MKTGVFDFSFLRGSRVGKKGTRVPVGKLALHRCLGGGIGRRARLKIWCPQGRVGSSPTLGTMYYP